MTVSVSSVAPSGSGRGVVDERAVRARVAQSVCWQKKQRHVSPDDDVVPLRVREASGNALGRGYGLGGHARSPIDWDVGAAQR